LKSIVLQKEDPEKLEKLLRKDFDAVCEYHKLKDSLSAEESKIIDKIVEANTKTVDDAINLFTNSLSLAWIDHIEGKFPDLRSVSSGKLDSQIAELRESIEIKRNCSKEILLLKAREKTYENLEFNRLKNRITYRDLQHQVTKKRRIWPIRRVIGEFTEELFTLLPCWMCSPESASAIFPMQQNFDLIIFDEASQCFAERGIPAMYRARQIVVSGDSQQLQPNDLYRVRWEDEDDTTPELAINSLLDLTKHYLPEVNLAGHYRSKSLELIDFSNEYFYNGKLRLLPDFQYVNKTEPAIKYIESHGIWDDGVNQIEAEKVVDLVLELIKEYNDKEIGIVTFNFKQQELIMDVMEERAVTENVLIPDSLFVKNIENVQGDEKDIIIFSVGYAPDKKGKVKLQFGSLNIEGGENRLNVAVTRAREKIFILSSIHPSQMQTDDTKNEGPKLLKQYLEYAWNVSNGNWRPHLPAYDDHQISWYLRKRLREEAFHEVQGLEIDKELPFADLSVRVENEFKGLILTDDERYHQALSPKQIYAFQHFHLVFKNWNHERFHSREFWIDPEATKEKLRKFLFKVQ
jgi:superfamily I DNA and/or RNA helicase